MLTAQVTVVEAEVTGVRGGRRADVKLAAEVHVCTYMCVLYDMYACHSYKASTSIESFDHYKK